MMTSSIQVLFLVVLSLALLSAGQGRRLNDPTKKTRGFQPREAEGEAEADAVIPEAIPAGVAAAENDGAATVLETDSQNPVAAVVTPADIDWGHLTSDVKAAAQLLGYTEDSWNNNEDVDSDGKYWNLLSDTEKTAAETLGYDQKSWDGEGSWSWFTDLQKQAAKLLGYDERTWNLDVEIKIDDKCWKELKKNQQQAAFELGFDQESWDAGECRRRR